MIQPLNQFQNYLVHEFVDDYNDGLMPRREMIRRVLGVCGGVAGAATMLTTLGVKAADAMVPAQAAFQSSATSPLTVAEDDPAVIATDITFPVGDGEYMGYQALPSGESSDATPAIVQATPASGDAGYPLVLICHENRGLTDHIRDVARRFAKVGYAAIAVDLVSPEGGTGEYAEADVPGILSGGDPARHVDAFKGALAHAGTVDGVDATRVAMIGYCFGGGITWRSAEAIPELKAAAPYYGPPPPLEQVPDINASVLGVYSEDPSDFANEGREELEAALEEAGTTFEIKIYPGTEHAFHNDTGARYNEEAALQAWTDTLAWFGEYV